MNPINPVLGLTFGLTPALGASSVPALLLWSTVLVWVLVALLLASVAALVAGRTRPQSPPRRAAASWARCMIPQTCAACARWA
jgi:hypothetical protein